MHASNDAWNAIGKVNHSNGAIRLADYQVIKAVLVQISSQDFRTGCGVIDEFCSNPWAGGVELIHGQCSGSRIVQENPRGYSTAVEVNDVDLNILADGKRNCAPADRHSRV